MLSAELLYLYSPVSQGATLNVPPKNKKNVHKIQECEQAQKYHLGLQEEKGVSGSAAPPTKKDGEGLFTRAWRHRTRGNRLKLKESRSGWDIGKKFLPVRVVRGWD